MKPLIGAAVFGLLPIPQPSPASHSLGDREGAAAHEKDREATCSKFRNSPPGRKSCHTSPYSSPFRSSVWW